MTNRWLLLLVLTACPAAPPKDPPPRHQPVAATTVVEYEVHGEAVPVGVAPVERDQPAHIKLKLGHFRNDQFNIGVTVDLVTDATDSVADLDPAKLRFDGDDKVWRLEGRHGSSGRVDYVLASGRVMLQMYPNGHVTVFVPDPDSDRAREIDVYRDGDADPL